MDKTPKRMKIFYYDCETTGTLYWKHGIHQISGAIEIDGDIKEYFDIRVQPNPRAKIDHEALNICGINISDLDKYMPFQQGYTKLTALLAKYVNKYDKKDKFFLCGYNNASFDNAFLKAFFVQNGDQYFGSWFWSSPIDVFVLAAQHLMRQRAEMENFQQSTVARQLRIEVDEDRLHDAVYDVEIMIKIYKTICKS